jgi:surfeit locus 1 family protein
MSPVARRIVVALAALVCAGVTARLGFWQLDRGAQKTALQASIDARGAMAPLGEADLASDSTPAAAQHHRPVRLAGHWSAPHTVFLDNRQMGGRPGFYVVTPLKLADGRAVLVQRGWAPRDLRDRARVPSPPTPATPVVVSGRLAPPPGRLYEFDTPSADAEGPIRQNLDLAAFARETGLVLVPSSVLQTEPAMPQDGLLRDWPAPSLGVAKHHGYAFQWFGLSALVVLLYVWFQLIQPRRRR